MYTHFSSPKQAYRGYISLIDIQMKCLSKTIRKTAGVCSRCLLFAAEVDLQMTLTVAVVVVH